jgi:cytochrome c oxidase cbb3-type subunit IV
MDYHTLREIADSWGLLLMTVFFIGVVLFAFRPGSRKSAEDAANIPFKED